MNIYQDLGLDCGTREEYLEYLAEEYGASLEAVKSYADIVGPDEDFDGLISYLEDYNDEE